MRANRFHGTGYTSPRKYVCRVRGCRKRGYGRYCVTHTPPRGVGILHCLICDKPLADHQMARLCS